VADCSVPEYIGAWNRLKESLALVTSHGAVVIGKYLWVVQGYDFSQVTSPILFDGGVSALKYDLDMDAWEQVWSTGGDNPPIRYGHTVAANKVQCSRRLYILIFYLVKFSGPLTSAVVVFLFLAGLWFTRAIINGANFHLKLIFAPPTIGYMRFMMRLMLTGPARLC